MLVSVLMYSRPGCGLCDEAREIILVRPGTAVALLADALLKLDQLAAARQEIAEAF